MRADDDPEARIRELERPLSDFARAAEITSPSAGAQGWASPRQRKRQGLSIRSGLLAAVFVAAAALMVFVMADGTNSTTRESLGTAGDRAPASSLPAPPVAPTPPVEAAPAIPAADSDVTISGAEENKTLACAGNRISVHGVRNTVKLIGRCSGLKVSGIGNVVTVDSTPEISVSGINNRVIYRSGKPETSTSGVDNIVERG